jgi:hypothetical protein
MSNKEDEIRAASDDLNKQIIGSLAKPYKGEQTSRWIKGNMDDEALVDEITKAAPSEGLNMPSPVLLDRLFNEFQRYAYEFQQSPAAGQHFPINVARPHGSDAPPTAQYGQVPILCQGHVSTAHWAMIFFGYLGKIQAFVVPVEYTVGFKPHLKEFTPFVELKAVPTARNETDWQIDGYAISAALLPAIAKRFFGSLIKVEREEAKYSDAFIMDPTIPIEEPAMPARLEEAQGVELLSDAVLQQEEMRKRQYQQASQQSSQQASQQAQYQSLPPGSKSPLVSQQQPRYAPQAQQSLSGDGENDTIPEAFDRNNQMLQAAMADFFAKMDLEVDRLTKIGMMAIQAQDMLGAQRTIIRSAKLKEMRERVNDLSNEWNAVVKE